jgi:HK97 family phage major capsid protein
MNRRTTEVSKYSETTRKWFRDFFDGKKVMESHPIRNWAGVEATPLLRDSVLEARDTDMLAGTQAIAATQGPSGGYLVPIEFENEVIYGMAQTDPLLDEDVVTLLTDTNIRLRPIQLPGWDLSQFAAVRIGEGNQQNPQTVPTVGRETLNGYTYKATLDATFELEDDAADLLIGQIEKAFSTAMARGIGVDLVLGTGSSQPQGLLTCASPSGITTGASGKYELTDFTSIYESVDRAYRQSPKCAWVMDDTTYLAVRQATDNSGRPLLNVLKDKELLLGKPVLISPSMPSGSSAKAIVFGDLSHMVVRVSQLRIARAIQALGYVDKGKALYTGIMRADAVVFDPSNGVKPPIVYATNHS